MKVSPQWLREFVHITARDGGRADERTDTGTAVESISEERGQGIFEMEITTTRVDAMNPYGIARECSAIYDRALKPISPKLLRPKPGEKFPIEIQDKSGFPAFTP